MVEIDFELEVEEFVEKATVIVMVCWRWKWDRQVLEIRT